MQFIQQNNQYIDYESTVTLNAADDVASVRIWYDRGEQCAHMHLRIVDRNGTVLLENDMEQVDAPLFARLTGHPLHQLADTL